MSVHSALQVAQIIISIAMVALIVLQGKGSGMSGLFGGEGGGGITKTRRGLEKTLFQLTIGLAIAFMIIAILTPFFTPS